jgi:hypothetical protein
MNQATTESLARIDDRGRRAAPARRGVPARRTTRLHTASPTWVESLLFVALMSGPPKFTGARDVGASLAGEIDLMVLIHLCVWAGGALWVLARLGSSVLKRGRVPAFNAVQIAAWLLIAALSLSLPESPGVLLTAFTLGQYAVMLLFAWFFVHRFGPSAYLKHLFVGVSVLAAMIAAAAFIAPDLVTIDTRLRGDQIADTGAVAALGLVFCLSNVPALSSRTSWGMVSLFGVLLARSQTRAAYVAVVVNLALSYVFGKGLRVRKIVPLLALLSLGLLLFDAFSSVTGYMIRDTETIETMSDRIPLWQFLTSVVMRDAPWTGLGYYAASRIWAPEYNPSLGNAHSVFFEILLGGGVVATTVFLILCALLLWYAVRLLSIAGRQPEVIAAVGLLIVTLLLGIVTSLAVHVGPSGFAFWSSPALLPALWRQYARAPVRDKRRVGVRRFDLRAPAALTSRSGL